MKKLFRLVVILIIQISCFNTIAQITYEPAFPNIDFEFPVEIQPSVDGSDRMFVVEQPGVIKVFPNDPNVVPANVGTFLDITGPVYYSGGQELGLLGLAFHPDFSSNGYFYVFYSADGVAPGVTNSMVLSRFSVDPNNDNLADPNSELVIFRFDKNQNNSNHNGGKIAFGPDGYLYISFGDGGGANDPQGNGQNKNTVFGSICRIDVDLDGSNPLETNPELPNGNYEIPSDNPLIGQSGLDEIYAYGIRNTWKFSFDFPTNRLWGADVGQNAFEEINLIENGNNYGWSRFEGESVSNSNVTINEPTTFPVFYYDRTQNDVSVTGGYVYRGTNISTNTPNIAGKYIFGDYVSGRVWALNYDESTGDANSTLLFQTSGQFISSFGLDENGELYFSDYGLNAQIYKLDDGITNEQGIVVDGFGVWESLGQGISNGEVNAVATNPEGFVYNAGAFGQAGGINANNIAVWDGTDWAPLGSGSNGPIYALEILSNGDLVAGGSFTEIGGVSTNGVAVWNGSNWSPLGTGIDGSVLALAMDTGGDIYAGGTFETNNGTTFRNIAVWDGVQWSPLTDSTTSVVGTNNEIRSLTFDSEDILYVGGNFDEAGGNTANRIATWNGSNWGTLGDGTSGFVQAITSDANDIYVGGNFAIAGNMTVNRIARWNKISSSWFAVGEGVDNNVNALLHDGEHLFVGGAFRKTLDTNNNFIVNNIARWNTVDGWEAMGTNTDVGVNVNINAMQFGKDNHGSDKIFVGGIFTEAGAINTSNTALWLSEDYVPDLNNPEPEEPDFSYYPNPTTGILILSEAASWTLSNTLGQVLTSGNGSRIDLSSYASGLYILDVQNIKEVKIIKQ